MGRVLVLSGTCGSGKSTVAQLLADRHGWTRFSEDEVWGKRFPGQRGEVGSEEHRRKRLAVREEIVGQVRSALGSGDVVVDATVHEATPDSIGDYDALFASAGVRWRLRVLHPRLDVAIARDAAREGWRAGAAGVETLWRKYSGRMLGAHVFIDTSDDAPDASVSKVLESLETEMTKSGDWRHEP